jgi:hypothetical protein
MSPSAGYVSGVGPSLQSCACLRRDELQKGDTLSHSAARQGSPACHPLRSICCLVCSNWLNRSLSPNARDEVQKRRAHAMRWLAKFTEHPESVGETYLEHMGTAAAFGTRLMAAGAACMVHSLLPFLFKTTASREIASLHSRMIANRPRLTGHVGGNSIVGEPGISNNMEAWGTLRTSQSEIRADNLQAAFPRQPSRVF